MSFVLISALISAAAILCFELSYTSDAFLETTDAAAFAKRCGAKKAVPYHVGLFDNFTAEDFDFEDKVIPVFWKEIKL